MLIMLDFITMQTNSFMDPTHNSLSPTYTTIHIIKYGILNGIILLM